MYLTLSSKHSERSQSQYWALGMNSFPISLKDLFFAAILVHCLLECNFLLSILLRQLDLPSARGRRNTPAVAAARRKGRARINVWLVASIFGREGAVSVDVFFRPIGLRMPWEIAPPYFLCDPFSIAFWTRTITRARHAHMKYSKGNYGSSNKHWLFVPWNEYYVLRYRTFQSA